MSPPPSSPGSAKKATGQATEGGQDAERKASEQAQSKLREYLKNYAPPVKHAEKDTLNGKFHIQLSEALPEFNTPFSHAFSALLPNEPQHLLFAQVCEHGKPHRHNVIEHLRTIEHRAVLPLRGTGQVMLSAGDVERFVVVYDRPTGPKISDLVARNRIPHNPHYLLEHILIPILTGLEQLHSQGISHGLINPDNLYFDDHTAIMRPC
ncbi:MAG: hypothetical protein K2Q01_08120, partial [Rickettsiales bacterium]|nr:hypothetical protein [Rickettsiales bacterium]